MTPDQFPRLITTAMCATPGGVLTAGDRSGLIRRGVAEGMTEAEARQVIEAQHIRPRHPVTRGIE